MITRNRAIGIVLSAVAVLVLTGGLARAQSSTKGYGSSQVQQFTSRTGASRFTSSYIRNQIASSGVTRDRPALNSYSPPSASLSSSKPFSSISRGPTVSPYLALNNSFNQVSDYYNIVRPQQEQRRVNQQLQRQNQANQSRLSEMAAQGPYSTRGNEKSAPTGHAAVFLNLGAYLNTGSYYSGLPAPR